MSAQASAPQLRPLGIGEILDVGMKIYTRNALTLFKIVAFVVLPAQILVNLVEISALPSGSTIDSGNRSADQPSISTGPTISRHDALIFLVGEIAAILINFVAGRFAQAGCFRAVADAYLGEEVGWRSSLRFALRRLPAIVSLSVLSIILVGLGTLLCVVPGIYLYVAFAVAVPVLLVEGAGPMRSLGRSRELVQGRWWGTLGVAVVGYLLVSIVTLALTGLVVGVAFANPARNSVTGFVLNTFAATLGSMIATPAAAAFITVLYIDLRVRKEGFDLLLLARRLGVERAPGREPPSFLPEPPPTGSQPPFWPPPPGWEPGPAPPGRTAAGRPAAVLAAASGLEAGRPVNPAQAREEARHILAERRFRGTSLPRPFHGSSPGSPPHFTSWHAAGTGSPRGSAGRLSCGRSSARSSSRLQSPPEHASPGAAPRSRPAASDVAPAVGGEDPADLERLADEAERRGDLEVALRLRFRAGLLRLGRARALPLRPSLRTREARRALRSARFDRLARDFDEVVYGRRPPSAADVETARSEWPQVVAEARR